MPKKNEKNLSKPVFTKGIRYLKGGMEGKEETIKPISSLIDSNVNDFIEILNKSNKVDKVLSDMMTKDLLSEWNFMELPKSKFELILNSKVRKDLIYGCLHHGDKSNSSPLIIIPGFSDKSFGWTVGRINSNREKLHKKFSDIYIFDNSSIDKTPNNLEKSEEKIAQSVTYLEISKMYVELIRSIIGDRNFSLLGRSAGGGISLMIGMGELSSKISELYLAAPGYSLEYMESQDLSKLPKKLIVSHSINDQKIKIDDPDGSIALCRLFKNNGDIPFEFQVVTSLSNEDGESGWLNHRITLELIDRICK
tara:strand:- start:2220 stop:3143 length:924 start_codon:yes stop_codon:yes gene_type:complete